MNKYKNKKHCIDWTPIKETVKMLDFSFCVWCFINIKRIIHPIIKLDYCFIFIPSFTHSKVVLNLSFRLLLNIKRYFEEGRKPNSCWSTVFPMLPKSMWTATVWFATFFKISSNWCECLWHCTVYWYGGSRTAADRMCCGTIQQYFFKSRSWRHLYQGRCWPNVP